MPLGIPLAHAFEALSSCCQPSVFLIGRQSTVHSVLVVGAVQKNLGMIDGDFGWLLKKAVL